MTQTVYGLVRDLGDGTSAISWFIDEAVVDALLSDYSEEFGMNEGSANVILTFPDTMCLTDCGFTFSDACYR